MDPDSDVRESAQKTVVAFTKISESYLHNVIYKLTSSTVTLRNAISEPGTLQKICALLGDPDATWKELALGNASGAPSQHQTV